MRNLDHHISFEKWRELTARDIFVNEEEKPKTLAKLYEMFGDDYEEEEAPSLKSRITHRG